MGPWQGHSMSPPSVASMHSSAGPPQDHLTSGSPARDDRTCRPLRGGKMSEVGKTHIVVMWTVEPDDVAEGDRIFESHGKWMTGHSRQGDTALLDYSISKGPELENPLDPNSP